MTDETVTPDTAIADAALAEQETSEQRQVRLDKRAKLLESGVDAYPAELPITTTIPAVRAQYEHLETGEETQDVVGIAGRVVFSRNTGKLCFASLQSGDGSRIQAMVSLAEVGDESLARWKEFVDLGDHVFVHGRVISSRRGELSIMVDDWAMAAKAILPLPNLHNELNEETRVRQRYLDLIVRDEARATVRARAAVMASLRQTFTSHEYLEVETPMLQTQHGGASARPFVTHSNAFDTELFLRIAPELFLKRAVVGGIDRVFEINRNFRNEGADSSHSPEFAMVEAYQAYGNYEQMADLTQELVQNATRAVTGGALEVTLPDGTTYDLGGEWPRIDMYGSLSEAAGREITPETPLSELQALAEAEGVEVAHATHGKYVEELWEHFVIDSLDRPTFVMNFRSTPRRSPGSTAPVRASSRSGTSTSAASSWRRRTRSSSTRWCSASASSSRRSSRPAATPRRCASTRSSCGPSSTRCPRRAAWAWGSTGCSWPSPASGSARRSCSRSSSRRRSTRVGWPGA